MPIYGQNAHLADHVLCVSSRWLKWKPADVKGMLLKDDIIISNQSLPLLLSLSPPCSTVIIYSPSHSSRKRTATFVNFHHCELMHSCTHSMCFSHDLISCYDSHSKHNPASRGEGKSNLCSAKLLTSPPFFFYTSRLLVLTSLNRATRSSTALLRWALWEGMLGTDREALRFGWRLLVWHSGLLRSRVRKQR